MSLHVPEELRLRKGPLATTAEDGNNGAFIIPAGRNRPYAMAVICSDGRDWACSGFAPPAWEHVSVSTTIRCPTWEEMCYVKSKFWDPEDVLIQFHPAETEYVNNHPYCLHMWRPIGITLPIPPSLTVGYTDIDLCPTV